MSPKMRALVVVAVIVAAGLVLLIVQLTREGLGPGAATQPGTGRQYKPIRAAFDAEFLTRPDGYKGVSTTYGFAFKREPMQMDPGLMYKACADGDVDVICGFATDGRIPAYRLQILEDDKGFFPPYYAAPLVRRQTLQKHAKLKETLNRLGGRISDAVMGQLNFEVDEKERKAAHVAREFLVREGLIAADAKPGDGSAGTVTIGGKHFTEQEILGEMMSILIECSSNIKVDRKLNLGGTMICFTALKAGDLDLYAEYTGTGLVNILKREVISDPDEAYAAVSKAFEEQYGLIWLKPFGFNNTYTLTMRRPHAQKLGIKTVSDLARYVNEH